MKVLLLNMPIFFNKWQNLEMPLGIAYIASELEKRGHTVKIRDYEVELFNEDSFKRGLKNFNPDIVGISFRSSSYASAKKVSLLIKDIDTNVLVILGGHHATAFPGETIQDMQADFVIQGEGEYCMPELPEALEGKNDFTKIKGLTYRDGGDIIDNEHANAIADLNSLNFPAWHLLPMDKYVTGSVLTSRGCHFSCIYCDKGISTREVRFRSPENIYQEIVKFEREYKKGRVYFVDDYLFLNKNRLAQLLDLVISDEHLKLKWYCQSRVDGIDGEIIKQAKKSGCEMIIYGIETGDRDELEYINKRTTLQKSEEAIKISKNMSIKTRANFMIDFPISTHKTICNSIRFAKI